MKYSCPIQNFLLSILLLICGGQLSILGQCPADMDGIILLRTQIEIDAFTENYPNCTQVSGLRIVGVDQNEIRNLENLKQITSVGEGGLLIENNSQISSLTGLQNIQTILGDCILQNNVELASLGGLEGLSSIRGDLAIRNNPTLNNLAALSQLRTLGGLEILNAAVVNLNGLEQLTSIQESIFIRDNPLLEDLSALKNITEILGTLWIWENPLLKDLYDFQSLQILNALSLRLNPQLANCDLPFLCDLFAENTAQLVIRENDCGCNSREEVLSACDGFEGLPICRSEDLTIPLGADFSVSILPEDIDAGSTDDCSFELQLDRTTFDCSDLGEQVVTLSAIDNEGNISTCTASVTVIDDPVSCGNVPLTLSLPDLAFPCEGTSMSLPLITEDFINITSLQLRITWDTSVLQFTSFTPVGITVTENDLFLLEKNILSIAWVSPDLQPINLEDGTVLLELQMEVIEEQLTEVNFVNESGLIDAGNENFESKEVITFDGSIIPPDCPLSEPNDSISTNGCCPDLRSLLINGDFESGNAFFESSYQHQTSTELNAILPGSYGIVVSNEASAICPVWQIEDHTSNCDGEGNVLIVNGVTGQNATAVIWEQRIDSLQIDTEYSLCGYLKTLQQCCFDVLPLLYFKVDGVVVDTFQLNQSSSSDPCSWQEFNTSFIAINTSQTISLCLDEKTLGDGNDLAIDDLSLNEIPITDFFLSIQDQRPELPEITASFNLIGITDDTLPDPDCNYEWTIALVDSIDINTQNIFLNPTNMMMGNAATGWGLTTSFPGYSSGGAGGGIGEGIYYIELELSNCTCSEDSKEAKVVGWRWSPFRQVPDEELQLSESSLRLLQGQQDKLLNHASNEDD